MDSRQRVQAALKRQPVDRTPRFEQLWPETLQHWLEQGLPADVDFQDHFAQ